jgi:NADH-quinone oxidoreductase subunit E
MDTAVIASDEIVVEELGRFDLCDEDDNKRINKIIDTYNGEKTSVISILLDIQKEYNYLPKHALVIVAKELDMFLSEIYSIATFYKAFSLKPRGKHVVTVCLGTACHVRGGSKIADALSRGLSIEPGETTEDMQFTLETVNCLGACALGPVVVVNEEYSGNMSVGKVERLLKKYRRG